MLGNPTLFSSSVLKQSLLMRLSTLVWMEVARTTSDYLFGSGRSDNQWRMTSTGSWL